MAPSLGESLPLEEWSDTLVRQLHGCPSVDEAKARVRRLLETWTNEAALAGQQAALNSNFVDPTHPEEENCPSEDGDGTMMRDEGDAERPPCGSSSSSSSSVSFSEDSTQAERLDSLQQANKVLFRAIHVLGEKNKRSAGRESEFEAMKAELAHCQEQKRKLEQANQMLQWQLRISMDDGASAGGCGSVVGF